MYRVMGVWFVFIAALFLADETAKAQSQERQLPFSVQVLQPSPGLVRTGRINRAPQSNLFVEELNANTVTIMSGNPNGTYLYLAYDMSAVLDDGNNLRVLPIVGKGGAQNMRDILYLKGIDMGITQSNILRYYKKTGELGKNLSSRLRYITRLYNEEMHLLVSAKINDIKDLRNKKVNFSDAGSGTQLSAQLIFEDLQIPVEEVNMGQADAFEAIKRGEIAATVLIAGKPSGAFSKLESDPEEYKFINVPYAPALQADYLPATLTHQDYPNLIADGETIETLAVGAVLTVFNWAPDTDRYRRVANFTRALFQKFDQFLEKPRHPKWNEVNLAAKLPGWTRFPPAEEMLTTLRSKSVAQNVDLSNADKDKLFREFMEWRNRQDPQ